MVRRPDEVAAAPQPLHRVAVEPHTHEVVGDTCPVCDGAGTAWCGDDLVACEECHGEGVVFAPSTRAPWAYWGICLCGVDSMTRMHRGTGAVREVPTGCRTSGCRRCHSARRSAALEGFRGLRARDGYVWYFVTITPRDRIRTYADRDDWLDDVRGWLAECVDRGWFAGAYVITEATEAIRWRVGTEWVSEVDARDHPEAVPYPAEDSEQVCPARAGWWAGGSEAAEQIGPQMERLCRSGDCSICGGRGVLPVAHLHAHVLIVGRPFWYGREGLADAARDGSRTAAAGIAAGFGDFPAPAEYVAGQVRARGGVGSIVRPRRGRPYWTGDALPCGACEGRRPCAACEGRGHVGAGRDGGGLRVGMRGVLEARGWRVFDFSRIRGKRGAEVDAAAAYLSKVVDWYSAKVADSERGALLLGAWMAGRRSAWSKGDIFGLAGATRSSLGWDNVGRYDGINIANPEDRRRPLTPARDLGRARSTPAVDVTPPPEVMATAFVRCSEVELCRVCLANGHDPECRNHLVDEAGRVRLVPLVRRAAYLDVCATCGTRGRFDERGTCTVERVGIYGISRRCGGRRLEPSSYADRAAAAEREVVQVRRQSRQFRRLVTGRVPSLVLPAGHKFGLAVKSLTSEGSPGTSGERSDGAGPRVSRGDTSSGAPGDGSELEGFGDRYPGEVATVEGGVGEQPEPCRFGVARFRPGAKIMVPDGACPDCMPRTRALIDWRVREQRRRDLRSRKGRTGPERPYRRPPDPGDEQPDPECGTCHGSGQQRSSIGALDGLGTVRIVGTGDRRTVLVGGALCGHPDNPETPITAVARMFHRWTRGKVRGSWLDAWAGAAAVLDLPGLADEDLVDLDPVDAQRLDDLRATWSGVGPVFEQLPCDVCDGSGWVSSSRWYDLTGRRTRETARKCPRCSGTGERSRFVGVPLRRDPSGDLAPILHCGDPDPDDPTREVLCPECDALGGRRVDVVRVRWVPPPLRCSYRHPCPSCRADGCRWSWSSGDRTTFGERWCGAVVLDDGDEPVPDLDAPLVPVESTWTCAATIRDGWGHPRRSGPRDLEGPHEDVVTTTQRRGASWRRPGIGRYEYTSGARRVLGAQLAIFGPPVDVLDSEQRGRRVLGEAGGYRWEVVRVADDEVEADRFARDLGERHARAVGRQVLVRLPVSAPLSGWSDTGEVVVTRRRAAPSWAACLEAARSMIDAVTSPAR